MSDYEHTVEPEEIEHEPVDMSQYHLDTYTPKLPAEVPESEGIDDDVVVDYQNARKTYYELVEKGKDALDNLLQIAASSEHPRAYEVAAQLIKTISESNDKIVGLQEQMRKIAEQDIKIEGVKEGISGPNGSTVNNNAIFVGNMKDFQMMVKDMRNKNTEKIVEEV